LFPVVLIYSQTYFVDQRMKQKLGVNFYFLVEQIISIF